MKRSGNGIGGVLGVLIGCGIKNIFLDYFLFFNCCTESFPNLYIVHANPSHHVKLKLLFDDNDILRTGIKTYIVYTHTSFPFPLNLISHCHQSE